MHVSTDPLEIWTPDVKNVYISIFLFSSYGFFLTVLVGVAYESDSCRDKMLLLLLFFLVGSKKEREA